MPSASMRVFLGFIAASHRGADIPSGNGGGLARGRLGPFAPYPTAPVPPFGVPRIADLCFWGGLYGAVFGLAMPRFTWPAVAERPDPGRDRRAGRHVHRRTD